MEADKCTECGGDTQNEYRACMAACASERYHGNDTVDMDTKGLISCNCCDRCRLLCYDSFMEDLTEEEMKEHLKKNL